MKKCLALSLSVLILFLLFALPLFATNEQITAEPYVGTLMETAKSAVGNDTVGGAAILLRNGSTVMMEGFGYSDIATRALVSAETAFEIGDLTSLLTVVTVLKTAEAQNFSLYADVRDYLPPEDTEKLKLTEPLTLFELLSHTAGFEGRNFDVYFEKPSHCFADLREALFADVPDRMFAGQDIAVRQPSLFGMTLAAYVTECITGREFGQLIKEAVLDPLEMRDTVLCPGEHTVFSAPAVGYTKSGEGQFTEGAQGGRSYSGLPYATGAVSTVADLSKLLAWLQTNKAGILSGEAYELLFAPLRTSSVFENASLAFGRQNGWYYFPASTPYFSCLLSINRASGLALLTLATSPVSALTDPAVLSLGETAAPRYEGAGENLMDLKSFRGLYVPASAELHSFVGKYLQMAEGEKVTVNREEGTITFQGRHFRQIGTGLFADTAGEGDTVALQFLTDGEGNVTALVTAEGACYRTAPFYLSDPVGKLLFFAVAILSGWFFLYGAFAVIRYLRSFGEEDRENIFSMFKGLAFCLTSACALWQILLCVGRGAGVLSSFYRILSGFTLVFGIGSLVALIGSFCTNLLHRKRLARTVRVSILFIAYAALALLWGLIPC